MGRWKEAQCRAVCGVCAAAAAGLLGLAVQQATGGWGAIAIAAGTAVLSGLLVLLSVAAWDASLLQPADSHSALSLITQYLVYRGMLAAGRRVAARIMAACDDMPRHQEALLLDILRTNAVSVFGSDHAFCDVTSAADYARRVPLSTYRNYEQHIEQIQAGSPRRLSAARVVFLATTSGTTGQTKLIPVTTHMRGKTAYKVGPLMYHIMQQKAGLSLRRVAVLSHKAVASVSAGAARLPKGPISSHMNRYLPFVLSPRAVYDVENEQVALYAHAVFTLRERDVGHVEALVSSVVFTFWVTVHRSWESICDAIELGRIHPEYIGDAKLAKQLNRCLRPDRQRADELRKIFKYYKDEYWVGVGRKVWPNLRFVRMLNTGGFAHHADILKNTYLQGVIQISQAHVASEGFMGFNLSPDPECSLYTAFPDYAFLEFIPAAEVHDETPSTLLAHQVSIGECYEMVLTTPMGLYRYRTGDIIKVMGFQGQSPVYEFQYRCGQLLNLYWEKTPESVFYAAVARGVAGLAEEEGVTLVDFTSTEDACLASCLADNPQFTIDGYSDNNKKHYVLFIELDKNGDSVVLSDDECNMFDAHLCALFSLYSELRHSGSIACMQVVQLQTGTFQRLKNRIISDTQNQQYKVPRVLRNPQFLHFLWSQRIETSRVRRLSVMY